MNSLLRAVGLPQRQDADRAAAHAGPQNLRRHRRRELHAVPVHGERTHLRRRLHLYEVDAGGHVVANYGSLGLAPAAGSLPMMTANQTQLVILNNGALFVLVFLGRSPQREFMRARRARDMRRETPVDQWHRSDVYRADCRRRRRSRDFPFYAGSGNAIANNVATSVLTGGGDGAFAVDITAVGNNCSIPSWPGSFRD